MRDSFRLIFGLLLILSAGTVRAEDKAAKPEIVPELTAYYTSLALYVPLTGQALPESTGENELEIYRELLLQSLKPQILLLEASVYPMPIAGAWLRRNESGLYADADLGGDINWVESVTAGFPEPAAVSVFLGSAMNLVKPGVQRRGGNKGHVGYLASGGLRHIRQNVLIHDPWYELEWKLKGERDFEDERLTWSFRLGTKQHSHPEITDTVYVGLRRGNLDYKAPFLAWLTNSQADFLVATTASSLSLARIELLIGKRYPLRDWGVVLALQLGAILENNRMYSGSLRENEDNFILVLRPNFEF